jgi:hypothetical protein
LFYILRMNWFAIFGIGFICFLIYLIIKAVAGHLNGMAQTALDHKNAVAEYKSRINSMMNTMETLRNERDAAKANCR